MIELVTTTGSKISIDFKRISAFKEEVTDVVHVYLTGDPMACEISMSYENFKVLYEANTRMSPENEAEQFANVYRKIAAVQETVGNMVEIMRGFESAALYHVHDTGTGKTGQPLLKTTNTSYTTNETLQDEDTDNG